MLTTKHLHWIFVFTGSLCQWVLCFPMGNGKIWLLTESQRFNHSSTTRDILTHPGDMLPNQSLWKSVQWRLLERRVKYDISVNFYISTFFSSSPMAEILWWIFTRGSSKMQNDARVYLLLTRYNIILHVILYCNFQHMVALQ